MHGNRSRKENNEEFKDEGKITAISYDTALLKYENPIGLFSSFFPLNLRIGAQKKGRSNQG